MGGARAATTTTSSMQSPVSCSDTLDRRLIDAGREALDRPAELLAVRGPLAQDTVLVEAADAELLFGVVIYQHLVANAGHDKKGLQSRWTALRVVARALNVGGHYA